MSCEHPDLKISKIENQSTFEIFELQVIFYESREKVKTVVDSIRVNQFKTLNISAEIRYFW